MIHFKIGNRGEDDITVDADHVVLHAGANSYKPAPGHPLTGLTSPSQVLSKGQWTHADAYFIVPDTDRPLDFDCGVR